MIFGKKYGGADDLLRRMTLRDDHFVMTTAWMTLRDDRSG